MPEAHASLDRRQAGQEPVPQLEELLLAEVQVDEVIHVPLVDDQGGLVKTVAIVLDILPPGNLE